MNACVAPSEVCVGVESNARADLPKTAAPGTAALYGARAYLWDDVSEDTRGWQREALDCG
jgi:hypothetical protein